MIASEIITQVQSEISENEANYLELSQHIEEYHVVFRYSYQSRANYFSNKSRLRQKSFWRRPAIWRSSSAWTISPVSMLARNSSPTCSPFTRNSYNPQSSNTWMKRLKSEYATVSNSFIFAGLHVPSNRVSCKLLWFVVCRLYSDETIRVATRSVYSIDFIIPYPNSVWIWTWRNQKSMKWVITISRRLLLFFKNMCPIFLSFLNWLRFLFRLNPKQKRNRNPNWLVFWR